MIHHQPTEQENEMTQELMVVLPGTKIANVFGVAVEVPDFDAAVENLDMLKKAWKAASAASSEASAHADSENGWVTEEEKSAAINAGKRLVEVEAVMRQQMAALPYELSK
jgi:hypothetical protein